MARPVDTTETNPPRNGATDAIPRRDDTSSMINKWARINKAALLYRKNPKNRRTADRPRNCGDPRRQANAKRPKLGPTFVARFRGPGGAKSCSRGRLPAGRQVSPRTAAPRTDRAPKGAKWPSVLTSMLFPLCRRPFRAEAILVFPTPWAYAHGYTPKPLRGNQKSKLWFRRFTPPATRLGRFRGQQCD